MGRKETELPGPGVSRWAGAAALAGGLVWMAKAVLLALELTDLSGPPFLLGHFLFAVGLAGLRARLPAAGGRLLRLGGGLAYLALLLTGLNLVYSLVGLEPSGLLPFDTTLTLAALTWLMGALLLGVATWQTRALPLPWAAVPLLIALAPLIFSFGGGLVFVSGILPWLPAAWVRETPIFLLGLGWALLGYALARHPLGQLRGTATRAA